MLTRLRSFLRPVSRTTGPVPRFLPRFESLEDRTVPAVTWAVQTDFFGTQDTSSQPRSLRGLALSSDDSDLYAGFIQGTSSSAIRRVSSGVNAAMIGNDGGSPTNSFGTNPAYTTGLEAKVTTFSQPKGVATDDRGNVYATLTTVGNSTNQNWAIYTADLSALAVATRTATNATSSTLSGIATAKLGGEYYAYIGWRNGQIERWNVTDTTNPVLDTAWGATATPGKITLKTISATAYLNGLEVDTDGTIFVAGGLQGTTSSGDALIKIPAAAAAAGTVTTATTSSVNVQGGANGTGGFAAMDVALYAGKAYVTEYLAGNSTVAAFYTLDLSSAGIVTPPNLTGPSGQTATYNVGADSGFSGIDISGDGKMYVVEQLYKFYPSTTVAANAFTPPGGTAILSTRLYLDRVIVSTALDTEGPVAAAVTAAPNPVVVGAGTSITLTATVSDTSTGGSTLAGAEYSTDGGTTWLPMTADDGAFDEPTEGVTAAFTLGGAGLNVPGGYTLLVRGKDTASQTGTPGSTTLVVQGTAPTITSAGVTTFVVGAAGTFTVLTTALPTAALGQSGALPAGVTFVDNGNGTATLAGTPAAGQGGVYALTITAANGVVPDATQNFTLTVNEAPTITSANAVTFTVGAAGSFTVTTGPAFPTNPALSVVGGLPAGVSFVDNGNGTATLAGTPAAGAGGVYALTVTAANGVAPDAAQPFTLTVNEAPAVASANAATFTSGTAGTFTVTTTGFPDVTLTAAGPLPAGVSFADNGDGTATLSGTPAAGTGGVYTFAVTAANGVVPDATQSFTLTVNQAPAITSGGGVIFSGGSAGTFTVTTTGFPTAGLSVLGSLPAGVTFTDNGDGTATLAGTPIQSGTFSLTLRAGNGTSPDAEQAFTLTVNAPPPPLPVRVFVQPLILDSTPNSGAAGSEVRVRDLTSGQTTAFVPFTGFRGNVSVAAGDVTGDGVLDVVVAAGAGGGPHVKVYDGKTMAEIASFYAYESTFGGGVSVAVGDLNDDGFADIVTGAGPTGAPHVKAFDGLTGQEVRSFYAYEQGFLGGVSVAAADLDGDGYADIITGAGAGGSPHVKAFDGLTGQEVRSFFAYDQSFKGGVSVAAGDLNDDGRAEIVTGAGAGGSSHVKAFDPLTGGEVRSFFAYAQSHTGGVSVAVRDVNRDGFADILTGAGPGGGPHVKAFDGRTLAELQSFFAVDAAFTGGVLVG